MSLGAQPFIKISFDFQNSEGTRKADFHMKGCLPELLLKQRKKVTQKWPISLVAKSLVVHNVF